MNNKSELKSGWLKEEFDRANRQVSEWKIAKYQSSDSKYSNEDAEVESSSSRDDVESETGLQC